MEWFLAAAGASVIVAAKNLISKKLLEDISGIGFTFISITTALVLYLPFFLYLLAQNSLQAPLFAWLALLSSGVANSVAMLSYNKAIKFGEVSEVIPLTKLSPVFVAVLAPLLLAEPVSPNLTGSLLLVAAGSYTLMLRKRSSIVEPFRNLLENRELQFALLPSIIWGFAAIADRFGNQRISPEIYLFFIFLTVSFNLGLYMLLRDREKIREVKQVFADKTLTYLFIGAITISSYYLIFTAYSLAKASKVVPVFQLQTLLTVIAGGYLFQEENLVRKLLGALILIAGIILVTL